MPEPELMLAPIVIPDEPPTKAKLPVVVIPAVLTVPTAYAVD